MPPTNEVKVRNGRSRESVETILVADGIVKKFPGVTAVSDVSFDLRAGEVHALVGENGAGKSTLIKILSGDLPPDQGTIAIAGTPVRFANPAAARALGIAAIFQELTIVPWLSVAENVTLGNEPTLGPGKQLYARHAAISQARDMLHRLGMDIDPHAPAYHLSVAQKQMIEIARALLLKAPVIIMDEPTAALSDNEADVLLRLIGKLRDQGTAIVFVSHRLEEVLRVADRVTVLRGGYRVATLAAADISGTHALIELMIGEQLDALFPPRNETIGDVVFAVHDLTREGAFEAVSFDVRAGEILGVAGLVGAGRTAVMRAIFGVEPLDRGTIVKNGKDITIGNPGAAIRAGIAYLPEDRKEQGLVLPLSGRENMVMASLPRLSPLGIIRETRIRAVTDDIAEQLHIAGNMDAAARNLSGGNQQKLVIGKWLLSKADLFIFDEPTRGIDIGAKVEVYRLMHALAEEGAAIILVSSELPELMNVCHRMIVMSGGRVQDEMAASAFDEHRILTAAFAAHVSLSLGGENVASA